MLKITLITGLPGSGKTTLARKIVQENERTVRLNRDDYRKMLFDKYWLDSYPLEKLITKIFMSAVTAALDEGYSVVVDNTNLVQKERRMYEKLAEEKGAEYELLTMSTDVETCIMRDKARFEKDNERLVGEEVIRSMAERYSIK